MGRVLDVAWEGEGFTGSFSNVLSVTKGKGEREGKGRQNQRVRYHTQSRYGILQMSSLNT